MTCRLATAHAVMDDEIDLKELFMVLWSGKWLICAITGVAAVASVVIALMLPNIYTANALVGAGRAVRWRYECADAAVWWACEFSWGFASRREEASRAQLGMALMNSRGFIGDFVERRAILPELMAVDSWDLRVGSSEL